MTDKEAMKLALFALDIVKMHYTQSRHVNEAITALKEALAQPEQEPVAWVNKERNTITWDKLYPDMDALYTHPPQRTWVGLTDEEIWTILQFRGYNSDTIEISKAVEAKLKEKNT